MELSMGAKTWSDKELDYIKDNYATMTNAEIAVGLGGMRTADSIQLKINRMGLKGENGRKPRRRDTYKGELPKVGDKFGKLEVVEVLETPGETSCLVKCECNPNITFTRTVHDLKGRDNHSCGCERYRFESTHGKSDTQIYKHWLKMRDRCNNPNYKCYHIYGGRGIKICEEWKTFANFYQWAIIDWQDGKTIDRINNDKGYEPTNCRWATAKEQANNRRPNEKYIAFGELKTLTEWAKDERCKVSQSSLTERLKQGYTLEDAIVINPVTKGKTGLNPVKIGDEFGKLTIISEPWMAPKGKQMASRVTVQCSCNGPNSKKDVFVNQLRGSGSYKTVSCGCLKASAASERMTKYNNK